MPSPASPAGSDRNLLFGIVALQMDFISRDQLVAAMNAWVMAKDRPLGRLLCDEGALTADAYALLDALVSKHLALHGDSPERSLAALSSVGSVRKELERIPDVDLHASLAHVSLARRDEPESHATQVATVDMSPSTGPRFRILRPHAKGGLGQVYVAEDAELHREVALKEIQERHADNPASRMRFLLEAQITGGLEHPGIVPVYGLGQYADGRPFYAMRFIKGDSLKEAIQEFHEADQHPSRDPGERTLSLRKLLRRYQDVCNAVAYAHSRGVLHRDLKPGNIMLGKYGETLVVDWGLAKAVGRPEQAAHDEPTLRPSFGTGSADTVAGSAVGTPQYMSPEQAAGRLDLLGPASDVYSLGATLYCLLTGRAPFEDKESGAVLKRVEKGDFPPPRQVKPTTPAPLEAICLKAMALRPESRYPSPRELAEDIEHWLADEPVTAWPEPWVAKTRRWMKRHRAIVAAAAASLIVAALVLAAANLRLEAANERLTFTTGQLAATNTQLQTAKATADENAREARGAVDRYYRRVSQEILLNQPQFLPLRKSLLAEALKYYQSLLPKLQGDPTLRRDLAETSLLAGRLTQTVGSLEEALPYLQRGRDLWAELAREDSSDPLPKVELALACDRLGQHFTRMERVKEARQSFQEAIGLWEELARSNPAAYSHELAYIYDNMGTFLSEMNLDRTKAWEYLHKGLAIMEPLVAQHPKNEEYVRGLAYFYNNRAMEYVTKNEPAAALEEHEKAIKLRRGLVRDYPNDTKYMHRWYLARSLMRAAQAGQKLEKAEVALARYRECRDLLTRLVNDSPAHLDYRNDLALCSNSYGLLLMERKKGEDALANFKLSADHLDRIVAADPARTSAQVRLSEAYSSAALALVELGRRAEAEAELQQALKHCRTAMEQQPKETSHRALLTNLLARSLTNNAALQRHPDAARAASERRQLWSKSADELFRLGCDLAQCMNLVGTGKGELSPTQEADRAKYGDLAVKTLRQAAAAGFSKVQEFEQGPALAPLRGRTDYQNLLKELATKR